MCSHHCQHLQNFLTFSNVNSVPMKHRLPTPTSASGTRLLLAASINLAPLRTLEVGSDTNSPSVPDPFHSAQCPPGQGGNPCTCRGHSVLPLQAWIVLHCAAGPIFMSPLTCSQTAGLCEYRAGSLMCKSPSLPVPPSLLLGYTQKWGCWAPQ